MNPAYHNVRFSNDLFEVTAPESFGIITACNPEGRKVTDQQNQTATEELRRALSAEGLVFFPVTGGSPDFAHAEPGFGVLFGSCEEALCWGRKLSQQAVFWVEGGLVYLAPCDGSEPVKLDTWQALAVPSNISGRT